MGHGGDETVHPSSETLAGKRARPGTDEPDREQRGGTFLWFGGCLLAAAGILVLLVGITGFTGLPGPEPIRRYPTAELQRVVDEINSSLAVTAAGNPANASVDWVRGRVRIDGELPCGVDFATAEDREMILPGYRRADCPEID